MKIFKSNYCKTLVFLPIFTFVLFVVINNDLSAQKKFTVQFINGTFQQYSLEGLILTFDNNGTLSILQNGNNQKISFENLDKILFSDQITNLFDHNLQNKISAYIDRNSDLLYLKGDIQSITKILIFSFQGKLLLSRQQPISVPIDISDFPPGLYILTVDNKYIKFVKP
jgi:hypothetical protein